MSLADEIRKRHSTRWYSRRPVPQEILLQVVAAGRNAVPLRPEIEVRWYIVWDGSVLDVRPCDVSGACEDGSSLALPRPHDPGHELQALVSPPHYVLAVSQERPGYVENLGFCMEQLILTAAEHGLGTCWIHTLSPEGASQQAFQERLRGMVPDLSPQERIVSLTPLGYPARSQPARLAQRLLRWSTDRNRACEQIFRDVWGVPWASSCLPTEDASGPAWTPDRRDRTLQEIWDLDGHTPSWGYDRPWCFIVDDRRVIALLETAPSVSSSRGESCARQTYARLGGGIAMCHFYLAAQRVGLLPPRRADLAPGTTDGLWRQPGRLECERLSRQHGIPDGYEVLGLFPLPATASGS